MSKTKALLRSMWELARFHTMESFLESFPAITGVDLAMRKTKPEMSPIQLISLIFGNWFCMTLIHGFMCTWNDIIDHPIDAQVERTKYRPLPSGRISRPAAYLWCLTELLITASSTYYFLGREALLVSLPIYTISMVYPFAKFTVAWPQFVLSPCVAWPTFVGWTSVVKSANWEEIRECVPLFMAHAVWTIYYDTAYGFQDIVGDKKAGVKSLALYLGPQLKQFMTLLSVVTVSLFSTMAYKADSSLMF